MGAAGAGKSTFARRWFAPDEILSSDDLRALVSGDAANQAASRAAFALLHRRLTIRLAAGKISVVDATNVRLSARRSLLARAAPFGHPAIAVVLDLPADAVHERNLARQERVVAAAVVDRQLADLRRSIARGDLIAEGFVAVYRIASTAVLDVVRLTRLAAAR